MVPTPKVTSMGGKDMDNFCSKHNIYGQVVRHREQTGSPWGNRGNPQDIREAHDFISRVNSVPFPVKATKDSKTLYGLQH